MKRPCSSRRQPFAFEETMSEDFGCWLLSAAMAGQTDVAASALQELRRAQPNISLAWIENQMPMQLETEREHYLEAFRRAGLE